MPEVSPTNLVRFGVFELDLRSGELRKAGVRVGLQEQALQVLTTLLERPGDLVRRDELRERLWPNGTFVDFDHGLNAVVNRLRDTLGDSAESPRFIETLPRRGYRFIAPIERNGSTSADGTGALRSTDAEGLPKSRPAQRARGRNLAAILAALLVVVAVGLWQLRRSPVLESSPARVVSITRLAGEEDWPAFSPDGGQLAFTWSGEKFDNTDIYVTLVGATETRRLTTDPADDYAPSWSPDGRHIAFLRKVGRSSRIHVISPIGGHDRKVSDFPVAAKLDPGLIASQIAWSPDSRLIAAGRADGAAPDAPAGIYLIPMDGGQPRPITQPGRALRDFSPAFSPDTHRLAYVSCDTRCDIRVLDVDPSFLPTSEARTLTHHSMEAIDGVAWSRDGRSIVFFGGGPDPIGIWRVSVEEDRGVQRIELAGEHAQHPATVASRDRLAFSRYAWSAHLYRFDPALSHDRIAASSSSEGDPHFSPDGRRLAFTSGRSGDLAIWLAAADGSAARQLTQSTWENQGSPSWSPDGLTIAFDAHDSDLYAHIWTIDTAGGPPHQITTGTGDQIAPTWSADGQWIYFSAREGGEPNMWRVRSTGGRPEQITSTGSGFLGFETFDGAAVLYQPKHGDSPLLLMPLSGGPPRQVVDCARSAAFATAGRAVFYVACEPGVNPSLHTKDLISGQDRTLGRLEHFPPDTPHVSLAVSPDGKTVVYRGLVRMGGDLMLIENFR
jgi:Tol biopolymer transport system component/DNA-binding winged helix-turn-helix (wHTH) protein